VAGNRWNADEYDTTFAFVGRHGDDLIALLDARPGARVLDLGCGTGRHAALLADDGFEVVGIDLDEAMLARARAQHPGIAFACVDARAFGPADVGVFAACLSNAALHWMTPQADVLDNVRSVLEVGAPFVAEMGGSGNIARMDAALRAGLSDLGLGDIDVPSNYFPTVAEQSTVLEAAGFRVESMAWFERPTPLEAGSSAADWTRHFRAMAWDVVPADRHDDLAVAVDEHARALGLAKPEGWFADYCRLRFVAVAV
jgi:trans-aconitate methyltransferase